MDTADRLIGALEREAELVDHGRFTIDDAAAQSKLARYRMAEPEAWPCLLVEAASLLGATRVAFVTGLDSLHASFDGTPIAADELFGRAAGRGYRAERKLAVAIHTLFDALGVGTIVIESQGVRVKLLPEGPVERSSSASAGTTITVLGLPGTTRERELLRERCRFSPLAVSVDYERASHGLLAALRERELDTYAPLLDAQGRTFGYVGSGRGRPTLTLLSHGVLAEHTPCSVHAVVDVPLDKDIGEHKVLHDDAYARLLADIDAGAAALATKGMPLARLEPRPLAPAPLVLSPDPSISPQLYVVMLVIFVLMMLMVFTT